MISVRNVLFVLLLVIAVAQGSVGTLGGVQTAQHRVLCSRSFPAIRWRGVPRSKVQMVPVHFIAHLSGPLLSRYIAIAALGPLNYRQKLPKTPNLRYRFCTTVIENAAY